jgi:hypothetical protein
MLAMRNDCRLSDRHGNRRRRRSLDLGRVSISAKDKMAAARDFPAAAFIDKGSVRWGARQRPPAVKTGPIKIFQSAEVVCLESSR